MTRPDLDHIARLLGPHYDPHYHDDLPARSSPITTSPDEGRAFWTTVTAGGGKSAARVPMVRVNNEKGRGV